MKTDENHDANRILSSILRILVESYEQTAAHSSLMIRDSDLRAGEKYFTEISPDARKDPLYLELILGTVLTIGLQAVIDGIPPAWLSVEYRFFAVLGGLILLIIYLLLRWWFSCRTRGIHQEILSRTFQDISDAYSIHSALSVRLQRDKQIRVALEAILLPLGGNSWEDISHNQSLSEVRENIDKIAEIDHQRLIDLNEYNRKGGDFWFELLQATLRSELPGFVCSYIEWSRRSHDAKNSQQNLSKWYYDATRLCNALHKVDRRLLDNKVIYQNIFYGLKEVRKIGVFSEVGFNMLLAICAKEPYRYTGPRAKLPINFL